MSIIAGVKSPKQNWSDQEKASLENFCKEAKDPQGKIVKDKWEAFADLINAAYNKNFSVKACRIKATELGFLNPRNWTEDQIALLQTAYQEVYEENEGVVGQEDWEVIASKVNRSAKACRQQMHQLKEAEASPQQWTENKINHLKQLCEASMDSEGNISEEQWKSISDTLNINKVSCKHQARVSEFIKHRMWSEAKLNILQEECEKAYETKSSFSKEDWEEIAKKVERSVKACQDQSHKSGFLKPQKIWTEEDKDKLLELCNTYKKADGSISNEHWSMIANALNRSVIACKAYASRNFNLCPNRSWSDAQEELLVTLYTEAKQQGMVSWEAIAEKVGHPSKSCQRKASELNLLEHLRKWTEEDKKKLKDLCEKYKHPTKGTISQADWEKIAEEMNRGVKACQAKAGLFGYLTSSSKWNEEAINTLKERCQLYKKKKGIISKKSWEAISAVVKHTVVACQQKASQLGFSTPLTTWTKESEQKLKKLCNKYRQPQGSILTQDWQTIAKKIGGQHTPTACRDRAGDLGYLVRAREWTIQERADFKELWNKYKSPQSLISHENWEKLTKEMNKKFKINRPITAYKSQASAMGLAKFDTFQRLVQNHSNDFSDILAPLT